MSEEGRKDYRNVYRTRRNLAISLLDLAKNNPLNKISVTDICRNADISRNAYYAHYEGLYSQVESLEDMAVREIKSGFESILATPTKEGITQALTALSKNALSHRVLAEFLVCSSAQPHFAKRLKAACADSLESVISTLYPVFTEEARLYYRELFFDAMFSLYHTFLQQEKPDVALFVGFAVRIFLGGVE